MAKQGKCTRCERRFTWERETKIDICICPICWHPLKTTSHLSNYKLLNLDEPPIHKVN